MKESEGEQFRESLAKFLGAIGELSNTDSIEKQVGKAEVYDNAQIISADSSRNPGSRAKEKGNPRDGGRRGKGARREANVTNWDDRALCNGNHQIQDEEYEGDDEYQEIFGGQSMGVRYAGNGGASSSDLDCAGIGKLWD